MEEFILFLTIDSSFLSGITIELELDWTECGTQFFCLKLKYYTSTCKVMPGIHIIDVRMTEVVVYDDFVGIFLHITIKFI